MTAIKPVLKWAGGKTKLLKDILPRIPEQINTYCEPFIGGGSVCFALQPKNAVIADINSDIIAVYRTIQTNPDQLIDELAKYKNESGEFYTIRQMDRQPGWPPNDITRAARMLYLNHTCFNGLYRVNSKGHFNVPYGRYKNPDITNRHGILELHKYLSQNNIQIRCQTFQQTLADLKTGDFAYLDPPYDMTPESPSFQAYTKNGFDRTQQEELKNCLDDLTRRNIKFIASNADTPFIRHIYRTCNILTIQAYRSIGRKSDSRIKVDELLITNF